MEKRTKILLLDPPYEYLVRPSVQIPLGLLYVASSLETNENYKVSYMDLGPYAEERAIQSIPEADVYGFTGTILDSSVIHRLSKKLKVIYPNCKIMVGGSIALLTEENAIDLTVIDAIIKGEGEHVVHEVVEDLMADVTKGVYWGNRICELDELPYPARHLVDENRHGVSIFYGDKEHKDGGSTNILGTRGCYFDCAFCGSKSLWDKKITFRDPLKIVEEMKYCKERWGINQFRFSDDNVTLNKKYITDLCREVKKLDVVWRVSIRTTPNEMEMFEMMVDAGCKEASFGIESFDPHVLKTLNKKSTPETNMRALENAKRAGLTVRALFMISTPGESLKTVDLNIEAFEQVKQFVDAAPLKTFVPIPGTDIFRFPDKYGVQILEKNYDNYNPLLYGPDGENTISSVIRIDGMTKEEQYNNIQRMRDYFNTTNLNNKG